MISRYGWRSEHGGWGNGGCVIHSVSASPTTTPHGSLIYTIQQLLHNQHKHIYSLQHMCSFVLQFICLQLNWNTHLSKRFEGPASIEGRCRQLLRQPRPRTFMLSGRLDVKLSTQSLRSTVIYIVDIQWEWNSCRDFSIHIIMHSV